MHVEQGGARVGGAAGLDPGVQGLQEDLVVGCAQQGPEHGLAQVFGRLTRGDQQRL
ncbi:MAG TPA: hypothetical protein VNO31_23915 [Umezawaea sp.]|nr:hypothetical protein [Umezawaea sp.]